MSPQCPTGLSLFIIIKMSFSFESLEFICSEILVLYSLSDIYLFLEIEI